MVPGALGPALFPGVSAVILAGVLELPVLNRDPVCPAALTVSGASSSQQGVVCRIMQADQESDPGLRMSAGALGKVRGGAGGVYLNLKSDPSTVTAFCHGDAVPVVTDEDGQGRASYTYCEVWQTEKKRIAEGLDGLYDEQEPEPVSMGVSSMEAPDPWAQARRDLDVLAPPRASG